MNGPGRRLAVRFAGRELRSGVRGFRIFLACLAVGVAALAAAGSTAAAFRHGLASQSRAILGGDVSASVGERRFTAGELAAFAGLGRTTDALAVRAMAAGPGGDRRLADVRGVDAAFPLAGAVKLEGAASLAAALAGAGGLPGAAVDPRLLERLHLRVGDGFTIGDVRFVVGARLVSEPDTLGRGFALGGAVLVQRAVLERSGLIQPGDLFGETVRVALRPGVSLGAALARLQPVAEAGVRIRDRSDAAGGLRRLIGQVEFFLGFIGLAALLAGGLGVSTAVGAYLETRRDSIAILKALGAPGAVVRDIYLLQVGALALLGVGIGLAVGAASPFLLGALAGPNLKVPVLFAVYPWPLVEAAAFGVMAAAAFGLGPLARARATPPSALFRRDAGPRAGFGVERVWQGLAVSGLAVLTVVTAPTFLVAGGMMAAIVAAFGLLVLIGRGAVALAARGRGFARGAVRLGLANLGGPSSAARVSTPAIGLGVALLATLLLIQSSILAAVREAAPRAAPTLVLTGIAEADGRTLDGVMAGAMGTPLSVDRYRRTPFVTGRIVGVRGGGIPARVRPGGRWAFDQDIGMTVLDAAPADADVTAGRWWKAGYSGGAEIAIADVIARAAGLKVGDEVTVSILGREIETHIAALRAVAFGRFGTSVPVVLDPAALAGAHLRQVAIARTSVVEDGVILRALGRVLPDVTVISVREQLQAIAGVFGQLAWATRGAAGVTALAGLLVLVGAIASTSRARAREAAILKVLGASRRQILVAYLVEYGAVGVVAASSGLLVGVACAWPVVGAVLHTPWRLEPGALGMLLVVCAAVCAGAGLVGAGAALAARPAPVLRGS
jgi:putative ABC transport system permease protein